MTRLRPLLAVAAACLLALPSVLHAQKDLKTDSQGNPLTTTPLNLSGANVTGLLNPARLNGYLAAKLESVPARTKEIFVAPARTDSLAGRGTQEDPADGGTAAKLAAVFAGAPAGSTVTLLPGTYTVGPDAAQGFQGRSIRGSGMYATTLLMAVQPPTGGATARYSPWNQNVPVVEFQEVSDLTVDFQAQNQPQGAILQCVMNTRRGGFERVRVVNWGHGVGTTNLPEAFGLCIQTAVTGIPGDVYIRDCVVEPALPSNPPALGSNTCLGINGEGPYGTLHGNAVKPFTGVIAGNTVRARLADAGIGLASLCAGVRVTGNHVSNAGRGFHQDTSLIDIEGVSHVSYGGIVAYNYFENCFPVVGLGTTGAVRRVVPSDFSSPTDRVLLPDVRRMVPLLATFLNRHVRDFPDTEEKDLCRVLGMANTKLQLAMKWV